MVRFKWMWLVGQVVLAVALMLMFFTTAPWLGTQSLAELPADYGDRVPTWAKGFNNDHGVVVFHDHGPIKEEPVAFAVRVAGVFGLFGLLMISVWFPRKRDPSVSPS